MSNCTCRVCTDFRRWHEALDPQTYTAKAAFDEIMTNLEAAETDATYWPMKYQGTWPDDYNAQQQEVTRE